MNSLISGVFSIVWDLSKIFIGAIVFAITAPLTIMILDDSVHEFKSWPEYQILFLKILDRLRSAPRK